MLRRLLVVGLVACLMALYLALPASALTYYGIDDGYNYGNVTADGSGFDPWGSTAASLDIPLGSVVTVCGSSGCEDVLVNDRGGGFGIEGLDVTKGVWQRINVA